MPSAVYPLSRYSFGEHSQIWQLSRILFSLSNQLKVHSAFFHILTAKKHNQQLLLTGIAPPVIQFEILDTVIHEPLMWYKLDSKSGNLYHSIRCPIFSSVLIFPEIQPFSLSTYTDFSIRLFFLIYSRLFLNVPLIHPCTVTKLPPRSIHWFFFFFSSPLNRDQAPPNFPRLTQLHSASLLPCCSRPTTCLLYYKLESRGEMPSSSLVRPALKLEVVQLLSCGIAFGFSVLFLSSAAGVTQLFSSLGWSRTARVWC